jgi:hypothetical protein
MARSVRPQEPLDLVDDVARRAARRFVDVENAEHFHNNRHCPEHCRRRKTSVGSGRSANGRKFRRITISLYDGTADAIVGSYEVPLLPYG